MAIYIFGMTLCALGILCGIFVFFFPLIYRKINEKRAEDLFGLTGEADILEEPLLEVRGTVKGIRCEVNGRYKGRVSTTHYFVTFVDDFGKETEYEITEEEALCIKEGTRGTLAVVNNRFYGFCPDE